MDVENSVDGWLLGLADVSELPNVLAFFTHLYNFDSLEYGHHKGRNSHDSN
jgi:hypothetical protein